MAGHDEVRDILAGTAREAVREVEVEPQLLPLENEYLRVKLQINTLKLVRTSERKASGQVSKMLS